MTDVLAPTVDPVELTDAGAAPPDDWDPDEELLAVAATLASDADAAGVVERVLEDNSRLPLTTDTFGDALLRLSEYFGDAGGVVLLQVVGLTEADDMLGVLEGGGDAAAPGLRVVRRWRAIYGRWLADANAIWQEQPDHRRRVDRDVFYDQLGSRWILSFTIFKYNGGSITIRGSANSLLNLAEKLLISLNAVPAPEAFRQIACRTFAAELRIRPADPDRSRVDGRRDAR